MKFVKTSAFLWIVVTASLVSASFAGQYRKLIADSQVNAAACVMKVIFLKAYWMCDEGNLSSILVESPKKDDKAFVARPRILSTVKTNDYGSFDPSPSLDKPPFKLIPN